MTEKQVDLTKGINDLNDVINQGEPEASTIETDLNKATDLITDELNGDDDAEPETVATDMHKSVSDIDLTPPQIEDAENGKVDAGEFLEKSLAYMEGVATLVKSLSSEVMSLKKANSVLEKGQKVSQGALGAILNSHKELHKSIKLVGVAAPLVTVESEFNRGEQIIPSKAQTTATITKGQEVVEDEFKKERLDDAEVNILAKALRDKTITDAEMVTVNETNILPKRLLS